MRKYKPITRVYPFKNSKLKNEDVQEAIFRSGAGLGPHLLSHLHNEGILKNNLIDSYSLGEKMSKYGNSLKEKSDIVCFLNMIKAVSQLEMIE